MQIERDQTVEVMLVNAYNDGWRAAVEHERERITRAIDFCWTSDSDYDVIQAYENARRIVLDE